MLLCLKASTEHCCSHTDRRTRVELLTWSFQHTIISMCNACVRACVRVHVQTHTGKATVGLPAVDAPPGQDRVYYV